MAHNILIRSIALIADFFLLLQDRNEGLIGEYQIYLNLQIIRDRL